MGEVIQHIVNYSGGKASWRAAERVVERCGLSGVTLLFADTLIEDEDSYRFLIESAAHVLRVASPEKIRELCLRALSLTLVEADMKRRKLELFALAQDAMQAVPGLVWIAEGRDPWDVFEDERFIGNSRIDPCSKILKRQFLDSYVTDHFDPDNAIQYFGLDANELDRFNNLRKRRAESGWKIDAPLLWHKPIFKEFIERDLKAIGIAQPRLYDEGFQHGNCGGLCVKAGHAQFKTLLAKRPDRYRYHEGREQKVLVQLGRNDVGIMRDRSCGVSKPLTMAAFRARVEGGCEFDLFDWGGCGCAVEP